MGGGVKRTNDPIFSFALKGAKEELFLKDTKSCFGEGSVYDVLTKEKGKFVILGLNEGHALIHYAEEKHKSFCRYFKEFQGFISDELGQKRQAKIDYYVRDLKQAYVCSLDKILPIVRKIKHFKTTPFAGDFIECYNAKEYAKAIIKALDKDNLAIYERLL